VEQRTAGVTLDRPEREVELFSDLRVASSLPEGELEDRAARVRQPANLLGQHDAIDQCGKRLRLNLDIGLFGHGLDEPQIPASSPLPVDNAVTRDADQPTGQAAFLRLIARASAPSAYKYVLCDLLTVN
jgi:hypothetical protein